MLSVSPELAIDEAELSETFVRASGLGGQNVNKVATAVQLRFDVRSSTSLPAAVRDRLLHLAASRITVDGVLLIEARRYRTQEQNRRDARERLAELIRRAAQPPKPRRPTQVPRAEQQARLDRKRRQGQRKRLRQAVPGDE